MGYPLVVQHGYGNHHAINVKIRYQWSFQKKTVANYQRVLISKPLEINYPTDIPINIPIPIQWDKYGINHQKTPTLRTDKLINQSSTAAGFPTSPVAPP